MGYDIMNDGQRKLYEENLDAFFVRDPEPRALSVMSSSAARRGASSHIPSTCSPSKAEGERSSRKSPMRRAAGVVTGTNGLGQVDDAARWELHQSRAGTSCGRDRANRPRRESVSQSARSRSLHSFRGETLRAALAKDRSIIVGESATTEDRLA